MADSLPLRGTLVSQNCCFQSTKKKTALCAAQPHRTSNAGILFWLKVLHVSKNTEKDRIWSGLESICSKNTYYQNRKPLNFLTSFFPLFFFFSTANSSDQELQVPAELQELVLFLWTFWIIWPETKHSKHIKQHTLTKQTWPGACQTVVSWICGTETPRWATSLSLGV